MSKKLASTMHESNHFEHERIRLRLMDEVSMGLTDVAEGRGKDARSAIQTGLVQRLIINQIN